MSEETGPGSHAVDAPGSRGLGRASEGNYDTRNL